MVYVPSVNAHGGIVIVIDANPSPNKEYSFMPSPLSLIGIIECFLIGFVAGAGWTLSLGLIKFLGILFGGK